MELEFYRLLMPLGIPEYMRDLFCCEPANLLEFCSRDKLGCVSRIATPTTLPTISASSGYR